MLSLGGIALCLAINSPTISARSRPLALTPSGFRQTNEPTNDPNVRKALALAVDQEQVFKAAFPLEGEAVMATGFIDPDLPCQDAEMTWYKQDIEAAKAALAASTYGSAENLPQLLRVTPRGTNAELNRGMEDVVEYWRQNLGITNVEFQQQVDGFGTG